MSSWLQKIGVDIAENEPSEGAVPDRAALRGGELGRLLHFQGSDPENVLVAKPPRRSATIAHVAVGAFDLALRFRHWPKMCR